MNKQFEINSPFNIVEKSGESSDSVTIKGYANTVSKDRSGDVIVKEAWQKGGLDNYLKNPVILAFHDHSRPIGSAVDYNITDKGLEIVAEISKSAGEVYNLIKEGILKTFSVGFSIKDADYDKSVDTFFIKDLELFEVSVVSIPANQDSTFSLAKSFTDIGEYNDFKKSFASQEEVIEEKEEITEVEKTPSQDNILKELKMDQKELQEMMAKTAQSAVEAYKTEVAEKDAEVAAEKKVAELEMGKTQAEKVTEELEARIKADGDNYSKSLEEMQTELKSAKDEMAAMRQSKMNFSEPGSDMPTEDELNEVFIASKILGKSIDKLEAGKALIEKATRMPDTDWETTWNGNIFDKIKNRVVVEPLFRKINMNARVMNFPVNADPSDDATWVATGAYNDGAAAGTAFNDTSSGARRQHSLTEVTMTAHKLATREYIGYEEEEDALLPVANIVRDAIVRRMALTSDKSILGTGIAAPFSELEELVVAGNVQRTASTTSSAITAAIVHATRTAMGQWGTNPSDLRLILSQAAYYSLMDETEVQTKDKYGDGATILTGELARIYGMPILVSDAFETAAADKTVGCLVNPANYMIGEYRNLTVETATDVVAQQRAIVATRRFGFLQVEAGAASKASMNLIKTAAS